MDVTDDEIDWDDVEHWGGHIHVARNIPDEHTD